MAIHSQAEKEAAYLYDLVLVPQWRERFDAFVDDTLKLPDKGALLEVGCGTGGYTVDLAVRGGHEVNVLGLDSNAAMLVIAQGKAEMQKVRRVTFQPGTLSATGLEEAAYAWVLGDASLTPAAEMAAVLQELTRVAGKKATVAVKLTTRGSFDEFFSIYWEALYELALLDYATVLERLMTTQHLTLSDAEALARTAGLKQARCETRKEIFVYADGQSFLQDALMRHWFLPDWLALLPDTATRAKVETKLIELIDRARAGMTFEISIKATLLIAQK